LTRRLKERGLRIPYGGTDTHLGNIDCKTIIGRDGTHLSGDMAARILDIVGIVLNRNTIPGDKTALAASGLRYGTPWITQRGLVEDDMVTIADVMADVLFATRPYSVESRRGAVIRAKIDFEALESARSRIRDLAESAAIDFEPGSAGYPHFYYLEDRPSVSGDWVSYNLEGNNLRHFVNYVFSSDAEALAPGESQNTRLVTTSGTVDGILTCVSTDTYRLSVPVDQASLTATWLRDLSDGYISFDKDLTRRIPGPVTIAETAEQPVTGASGEALAHHKPYFIGIDSNQGEPLPDFVWEEKEPETLRRTPLYDVHRSMGAKIIPFAGWEMPVWYTSVVEEHQATRQAAGLFDVAHMGVYQAEGPDAAVFLDSVCGNDIAGLAVGESCYTHFLDPDANVIDDTLVYRRSEDRYLVVVNASNDDKDWAWLNAVKDGAVKVDNERPWVRAFGRGVVLRDLRDPAAGDDMRVDIALQGAKSREILLSLGVDGPTRRRIMTLKRTELCDAQVGDFDLVVSRTGYTGERMAFELFVHPDRAVDLWNALLKAGEPLGLKACGLGARDSLRTEAGLPLYGQEMGGELNLGVAEAGFGAYVKTYKPWFIGRAAFTKREEARKVVVARFRFVEKGVRMAHLGDPVLDPKGRVIGTVTSCAIDREGYLTGQAVVDKKYAQDGTPVLIFQGAPKSVGKVPAELNSGDRFTLPAPAMIASRFPKLT
jgi:glycine hydroxymethyltransferase